MYWILGFKMVRSYQSGTQGSRRGMFLGFSAQHSSTVGHILNLMTRHISPRYHIVYDELFSTVTTTQLQVEALGNNNVFALEQWNELIMSGYE
jgi:hypothetical protein